MRTAETWRKHGRRSCGFGNCGCAHCCLYIALICAAVETMSAPPLPPLPPKPASSVNYPGPPPPIPPLPRDLLIENEKYNTPSVYELESPPHFENPLIAPRPHKVDRSIPANVGRLQFDDV